MDWMTIASIILYWTLDVFDGSELLLKLNLLFGAVYLPWQLINLRILRLNAKNQEIISYLKDKSKINKNIFLTKNMGSKFYYSALRRADFMIGNSSSGIIESLAFNLPVVNIGTRQQGRDCNINVVHASETLSSIKQGIKKSLSLEFRKSFKGTKDIYLKRDTTRSILNKLENLEISKSKLVKKFYKL